MKIMSVLLPLLFVAMCSPDLNNPLDEQSSSFIPPEINIDAKTSTIINGETIHFNSGVLSVSGNKEISRFRYQLDGGEWSIWEPQGNFAFNNLSDGKHNIIIETKYDKGIKTYSDTIKFGVQVDGYKPGFTSSYRDTFINSFPGKSLSIIETAVGADSIKYEWVKNGKVEKVVSGNALTIDSFSVNDTGSYYCVAKNKFGEINSRTYWLKYLVPKGAIKGNIIDIIDSAKVSDAEIKITPIDAKIKTGIYGKFEFTGLLEGKYSVSISHADYKDTTIENVEVGDTTTVDLGSIYLKNAVLYTIKFEGNENDSGKTPVDDREFKKGVKVAAPDQATLFRRGYSFAGWNSQEEGNGDQYREGDSLTITGNITLYAQWSVNEFIVGYSGNGNTAGEIPAENKYSYGYKVSAAKIGTVVRDGYKFTEWNSNKEGTGFSVMPESSFTVPDSNVVLNAQWEKLALYKVIYNGNGKTGGEVPIDSEDYYKGKTVVVKGNPDLLEKEGLLFAGWCTNPVCEGEVMNSGSQFTMPDSEVTLYAKWTNKPTYSIVYHGNGNEGGQSPEKASAEAGRQITIASGTSLVKTGSVVGNWNTAENGSGTKYEIDQKITMDTINIDLYAQWTKAQYTVTYHGNGSVNDIIPPKTTHLYLSEIVVAEPGEIAKPGYNFIGWNTDSTGNGLDYQGGSKIAITNNVDLYARWEKKKRYIITFVRNGDGTNYVPDQTEYEIGVFIDSSSVIPKRQGYSFNGWFKDALCKDKWIYNKDSITIQDSLYAKWIIKDVDGNTYTETRIGNQVWMVENLKVTRYRDSSWITLVEDNGTWEDLTTPGYCWYDNDSGSYKNDYGTIYNWYVVNPNNEKKVAPNGWHIPTDKEWDSLINYIGGSSIAGGDLKETGTLYWKSPNEGSTNRYGFSARAGGVRGGSDFYEKREYAYWWTSTEYDSTNSWMRNIGYGGAGMGHNMVSKSDGLYIRCIRDY